MKRKLIINVILFGILGYTLSVIGAPFTTWGYWVILLLVVGIQVNSSIDD